MSGRETGVRELSRAETALESLLETLLSEVPEYRQTETAPAHPVAETAARLKVPEGLPTTGPGRVATEPPDDRPGWAGDEFKVLLVRLGELRVAVPLVRLSFIAPAGSEGEALRLPAQPAWHRGVMAVRERRLVRVDPVSLLGLATERGEAAYLLVIDDGRYGLEVDAMEEPLSVASGEVRWRRRGEGRDWALGVLPGQMCVLLDLDAIVARLNTGA